MRPVTTRGWAILVPRVNGDNLLVGYDLLTSARPNSPRTFMRLRVPQDPNQFHVWSPDGSKIALQYSTGTGAGLYVVSIPGGRGRFVVRGSDWGWPVWSPDSRRLAFSRPTGLYVSSLNGRPARRFSSLTLTEGAQPISWAPDGKSVACYCGGKLRIVAADGSGSRQLAVSGDKVGPNVTWSPSGRYLAYEHDCGLHGLHGTSDAYCTVGFASPSRAKTVQPHPSICAAGASYEESLHWASDDTLLVELWGCGPGSAGGLVRVRPSDGTVRPAAKSFSGGSLATGPNGTFAFLTGAVNAHRSTLVIVDRNGRILQRQAVPTPAFDGSSISLN